MAARDRPAEQEAADRLAPRVLAMFRHYLALLRPEAADVAEQLPDDPTVLSHLVAATAALTLDDRQRLLAAPDTGDPAADRAAAAQPRGGAAAPGAGGAGAAGGAGGAGEPQLTGIDAPGRGSASPPSRSS